MKILVDEQQANRIKYKMIKDKQKSHVLFKNFILALLKIPKVVISKPVSDKIMKNGWV